MVINMFKYLQVQGCTTSLTGKIAGFLQKDVKNMNGPKALNIRELFIFLIIQMPSFKFTDKKIQIKY